MNFKLEQEFSKTDIIKQVDELKHQIDAMRPLPPDVEGRVMQKLRLDWNYHSNAIEGNRLSYGETIAFLMEGITAKGKPLKDHLDIRGHNEAINFLLSIVKDTRPVTEADIRALHKMTLVEEYDVKASTADGLPTTKRITLGEYKTSPNHVKTATGEIHYYATPEETPAKMQELMEWYSKATEQPDVHPLVIAALFHHKFVSIHPFDDGNGRMSRILMNLILMQSGYPPVVVKMDDRISYYSLLNRADNGDDLPFISYIAKSMLDSLKLYLKAAKGGAVEENDDVDKKIALLKIELQSNLAPKEIVNVDLINNLIRNEIGPMINKVLEKTNVFAEFFHEKSADIHWSYYREGKGENKTLNIYSVSFIEQLIVSLKEAQPIRQFEVFIGYNKYKNPDNDFNVDVNLKVFFKDYEYGFYNEDYEFELNKGYNERLSALDEQKLLKAVINNLEVQIQQNMSSD